MILYLDTSSLVKLFVEEPGADEVVARADSAEVLATSVIAYAEAHAAMGRRHREGAISKVEFQDLLARFREAWLQVLSVALSTSVYTRAGPLAVQYALRGMDAIHLSSYVELLSQGGTAEFLSHDRRLTVAAARQRRRYAH